MVTLLKAHVSFVFTSTAVLALPLFYGSLTGISWYPLNPHDHLIQHGLAYLGLVIFSYFTHTVFVPWWYLSHRYSWYALPTTNCQLPAGHRLFLVPRRTVGVSQTTSPACTTRVDAPTFPSKNVLPPHPGGPIPVRQRIKCPSSPPVPGPRWTGHPPTGLVAKLAIICLLGSVSVAISIQTAHRLRQIETDQFNAELQQLKGQIQPHFLFNTLNSIYALATRQDAKTAGTIVQLAEFMRYNIREAHRDKVPLINKITDIDNYIALQEDRLREAIRVDYQLIGDATPLLISTLLLVCFIENAFKYGVSPEEDSPIHIHLHIQTHQLTMLIANQKMQTSPLGESTGIGLQNVRQRLRLLYPDDHELHIEDTPTMYRIILRITLL